VNAPPTTAKERMGGKSGTFGRKGCTPGASDRGTRLWPDQGSAWVPSFPAARIGENRGEWRLVCLGHICSNSGAMEGLRAWPKPLGMPLWLCDGSLQSVMSLRNCLWGARGWLKTKDRGNLDIQS